MPYDHLIERSPMKAVATSTRGGLQPGQIGACFARSGVGKTAFIVQIAMYQLLRGTNVLHISRTDNAAHVRSYYDELFSALAAGTRREDKHEAAVAIERHRVIHSSLDRAFGAKDMRKLAATLADVMDFRPTTVVIDGMEADELQAHADDWRALARELKVRLWLTVRTHRADMAHLEPLAACADTAVVLEPNGPHIDLHVLRQGGAPAGELPALALDPVTMLLRPEDVRDANTAPPSPHAEACTLYTGGAVGAEAWFGECAEKWGVAERNFSFEGHEQARTVNRVVLDEAELSKGGVSLVYVANRLHRSWKHRPALRKVLQVLWHVVSHADQVFVIGAIQPDGTVHGGTGWSVELARRWNKRVWVFDQPHEKWFTWRNGAWVQGTPVIEASSFAGTGTRFLTDAGKAAVADLFERSFASHD
ncbi:hypothetical protein L6R53_30860 [Myxococcota bacterium]|nr:hypothetical protein [Myxococcota bacterium]